MKNNFDWDLIIDYLEGNCKETEIQQIREWLGSNVENKKAFESFRKVWETPKSPLPKPDVEKALAKVLARTGISEDVPKSVPAKIRQLDSPRKEYPLRQTVFTNRLLKIAAVILFMITASYLVFKIQKPLSENVVSVEYGQQKTISLEDGTIVTLDAGSIFRFPDSFSSHQRIVQLSGEAYFNVMTDQKRSFILHANHAVITVLGTEFNVRAWNQSVGVAVVNGKVALRLENDAQQNTEVTISKDQMSFIAENGIPIEPQFVDIQEHLSWLNREKVFKNSPLSEVLDQLERWYNVELYLSDTELTSNRISISIENKPITEILDLLAIVNNCRYERENNKITFFPKD